jgi:hypothetical protein
MRKRIGAEKCHRYAQQFNNKTTTPKNPFVFFLPYVHRTPNVVVEVGANADAEANVAVRRERTFMMIIRLG